MTNKNYELECTRCGGYGKVASEVDGGICYKCNGVGIIKVTKATYTREQNKTQRAKESSEYWENAIRLVILPASENTFKDKGVIKSLGFKFNNAMGWNIEKMFDNKAQAEEYTKQLGDKARNKGLHGVIATTKENANTMVNSPQDAQRVIKREIEKEVGIR